MAGKSKSVASKDNKGKGSSLVGKPEGVDEVSTEAQTTFRVKDCSKRPKELIRAEIAIEGLASNASIANAWQGQIGLGNGGMTECVETLRKHVQEVKDGDLGYAEAMLVGQASALNALFANMIARAARNVGEYPEAFERYMRLALKAQSQCRTTLEALAEIRFPRQVAFVKQANIAHGHQQVNNGTDPLAGGKTFTAPNKELEAINGQWVDGGTQAAAIGSNPALEAVVESHRTKDKGRKGTRGR